MTNFLLPQLQPRPKPAAVDRRRPPLSLAHNLHALTRLQHHRQRVNGRRRRYLSTTPTMRLRISSTMKTMTTCKLRTEAQQCRLTRKHRQRWPVRLRRSLSARRKRSSGLVDDLRWPWMPRALARGVDLRWPTMTLIQRERRSKDSRRRRQEGSGS